MQYFSGRYSFPLINFSIFIYITHIVDHWGFIENFEISMNVIILQDCFDYSGCFVFPYKLKNLSTSTKNLSRSILNSYIIWWELIYNFSIPPHEYGIFFDVFKAMLDSYWGVLKHLNINIIFKYFIFLILWWMGCFLN